MRALLLRTVVAAVLLLAACTTAGGDTTTTTAATSSTTTTTAPTTTSTTTTTAPTTTVPTTTSSTTSTTTATTTTTTVTSTTVDDSPETVDVSIVDFSFNPGSLTVDVGDNVRWTNNGAVAHTSTGAWNSGTLGPGASFSQTFDAAGTFAYACAIHPSMTATVVVEG